MLFSTGQYRLTDEGRARINAFLPVYLNVLFSDEYRPYISEIIIEGHTDSLGGYIQNLELSQQRAGAVAAYVLRRDQPRAALRTAFRPCASWSRPTAAPTATRCWTPTATRTWTRPAAWCSSSA